MGYPRAVLAAFALVASIAHAKDSGAAESGSKGCAPGYSSGSNTVFYTVPYSYDQVSPVFPYAARYYGTAGAHIETTSRHQSNNGPYVEVHTLRLPSAGVYSVHDEQFWLPVCEGKATAANFTTEFCATDISSAKAALSTLHKQYASAIGRFLGGQVFTSCEALGASSQPGMSSSSNSTAPSISGNTVTGTVVPTVIPHTVIAKRATSNMVNTVAPNTVNTVVSNTVVSNTVVAATKTATASGSTTTSTTKVTGSVSSASGSAASSTAKATYTGAANARSGVEGSMGAVAVALIVGGLSF